MTKINCDKNQTTKINCEKKGFLEEFTSTEQEMWSFGHLQYMEELVSKFKKFIGGGKCGVYSLSEGNAEYLRYK